MLHAPLDVGKSLGKVSEKDGKDQKLRSEENATKQVQRQPKGWLSRAGLVYVFLMYVSIVYSTPSL
jgi:hypothetical protein